MLIDRKNYGWLFTTVFLLGVSTGLYCVYASRALNGPSGGTWPGLAYGIAGFLMLLFVGLLGFRRWFPAWRIGRAELWLRGHLWLGLLGFGLILFHSGFKFGGPLTTALMVLLITLTASGIIGIVLQQVLPRLMTAQVPMETIYEQIDHVIEQLRDEAKSRVTEAAGLLDDAVPAEAPARAKAAPRPWSGIPDSGLRPAAAVQLPKEEAPLLKDFYLKQVAPYLEDDPAASLANAARALAAFDELRKLLPPPFHDVVEDLKDICAEYRQLRLQQKLHRVLHAWLLIHVPLSYAFLVLAFVHVFMSLKF